MASARRRSVCLGSTNTGFVFALRASRTTAFPRGCTPTARTWADRRDEAGARTRAARRDEAGGSSDAKLKSQSMNAAPVAMKCVRCLVGRSPMERLAELYVWVLNSDRSDPGERLQSALQVCSKTGEKVPCARVLGTRVCGTLSNHCGPAIDTLHQQISVARRKGRMFDDTAHVRCRSNHQMRQGSWSPVPSTPFAILLSLLAQQLTDPFSSFARSVSRRFAVAVTKRIVVAGRMRLARGP